MPNGRFTVQQAEIFYHSLFTTRLLCPCSVNAIAIEFTCCKIINLSWGEKSFMKIVYEHLPSAIIPHSHISSVGFSCWFVWCSVWGLCYNRGGRNPAWHSGSLSTMVEANRRPPTASQIPPSPQLPLFPSSPPAPSVYNKATKGFTIARRVFTHTPEY